MGYITPEITGKFPGMLSPSEGLAFADIPNGLGAISKVPFNGWIQIVAYCLYCEAAGLGFKYADDSEPGERNWKPPLLATADPERRKKRLAAELANGRLAMVAIIGMFFQDGLTGEAWGDWSMYTDSPLRTKMKGYTYDAPDWMEAAPSMPDLVTDIEDVVPNFPAYKTDKTPETCPQDCIRGTGGPLPENYWDPAGLSKN